MHQQTRTKPMINASSVLPFSVWTKFTVSTGKRSEQPRGMALLTRMVALQAEQRRETQWHSSSVNLCRNMYRTINPPPQQLLLLRSVAFTAAGAKLPSTNLPSTAGSVNSTPSLQSIQRGVAELMVSTLPSTAGSVNNTLCLTCLDGIYSVNR
jgi:hypothetical protein